MTEDSKTQYVLVDKIEGIERSLINEIHPPLFKILGPKPNGEKWNKDDLYILLKESEHLFFDNSEAKMLSEFVRKHETSREEHRKEVEDDFDDTVDICWQSYQQTQNSLYLWELYLMYRQTGHSVPDEVFVYFDEVAKSFLEMAGNSVKLRDALRKNGQKSLVSGQECLKALQLYQKGKRNAFLSYRRDQALRLLNADIANQEMANLEAGMTPVKAKTSAIKKIFEMQERELDEESLSFSVINASYNAHKKSSQK